MVKRKKRLLLFVCVLLLIIGWAVTFISITAQGEDIVGSQNELVMQARRLSQDKLYKRAELLYTQALTDYDTVYNTDIERELLELYKEADDSSAYYSLMEERVDAARAEEDEYIELSTRYADSRRKEDAIDIARRGLSVYDSTQLENIYNSLLYEYKTVTVGFDEFTLPADSDLIPYYNGTSWGYVNSDGDMVLSPVYEEATAFSGDYAVVRLDGTYTLIDRQGNWYAVDKSGLDKVTGICGNRIIAVKNNEYAVCSYDFNIISEKFDEAYISSNGTVTAKKNGKWALINSADGSAVTDYLYDEVVLNSHNEVFAGKYGVVKDSQGYFVIDSTGKELNGVRYPGAKGFEGTYYAVSDAQGRWGYAGPSGEITIGCRYDDAFSFSDNVGAVKKDGAWNYINSKGQLVIEGGFSDAHPFTNGYTFVTAGGEQKLISFTYYTSFE